jgi:hypothetical protein
LPTTESNGLSSSPSLPVGINEVTIPIVQDAIAPFPLVEVMDIVGTVSYPMPGSINEMLTIIPFTIVGEPTLAGLEYGVTGGAEIVIVVVVVVYPTPPLCTVIVSTEANKSPGLAY